VEWHTSCTRLLSRIATDCHSQADAAGDATLRWAVHACDAAVSFRITAMLPFAQSATSVIWPAEGGPRTDGISMPLI